MNNNNEGGLGNATGGLEEVSSSESDGKELEVKPKAKRALTEKQKETLDKGRARRDELRRERLAAKQKEEEDNKKALEEKIVKKAIQIKKKQIKQQKVVEPESEETDDEPPQSKSARSVALGKAPARKQVASARPPLPPTPKLERQRQIIFL